MNKAIAELSGVTLESIVIIKRVANMLQTLIQCGTAEARDFAFILHIHDVITQGYEVDIPWD